MKGRILIVDDEETARKSLLDILRLEGYQVAAAADGAKALQLLSEEPFDLMLLDLKMPGMSGLDVLDQARTAAPDTKVIMLTAHGSLESAIQALRRDAHDYILKPAKPQEILASVGRALGERADTERTRRLIEQVESTIQQLKNVSGLETNPEPVLGTVMLSADVQVDLERREIWSSDETITLTPTEGKLMKVMIENRGRVLSHRELVLLVQGYQTTDWEAPEIMRPLVSRLRRKLAQFEGGEEWIANVRGTGYVFDGK
ncbi:MAG: response regulator transcription factor [Anaerolineae bacterium]|nr:MAG: response regulator transcription factor [Anaerolineae bacterium]